MGKPTTLGEFLKEKRAERRVSRRAFALEVELDPAYYARIERGIIEPPREGVLNRIAEGLRIAVPDSHEWNEMVRLAELGRGQIPSEFANDEELAALLPAFFARLKQDRPKTADEMYDVYRSILKSEVEPEEEPA